MHSTTHTAAVTPESAAAPVSRPAPALLERLLAASTHSSSTPVSAGTLQHGAGTGATSGADGSVARHVEILRN